MHGRIIRMMPTYIMQPDYLLDHHGDTVTLRNYQGKVFHYRNPGHPESGGAALPPESLEEIGEQLVRRGNHKTEAAKCASA